MPLPRTIEGRFLIQKTAPLILYPCERTGAWLTVLSLPNATVDQLKLNAARDRPTYVTVSATPVGRGERAVYSVVLRSLELDRQRLDTGAPSADVDPASLDEVRAAGPAAIGKTARARLHDEKTRWVAGGAVLSLPGDGGSVRLSLARLSPDQIWSLNHSFEGKIRVDAVVSRGMGEPDWHASPIEPITTDGAGGPVGDGFVTGALEWPNSKGRSFDADLKCDEFDGEYRSMVTDREGGWLAGVVEIERSEAVAARLKSLCDARFEPRARLRIESIRGTVRAADRSKLTLVAITGQRPQGHIAAEKPPVASTIRTDCLAHVGLELVTGTDVTLLTAENPARPGYDLRLRMPHAERGLARGLLRAATGSKCVDITWKPNGDSLSGTFVSAKGVSAQPLDIDPSGALLHPSDVRLERVTGTRLRTKVALTHASATEVGLRFFESDAPQARPEDQFLVPVVLASHAEQVLMGKLAAAGDAGAEAILEAVSFTDRIGGGRGGAPLVTRVQYALREVLATNLPEATGWSWPRWNQPFYDAIVSGAPVGRELVVAATAVLFDGAGILLSLDRGSAFLYASAAAATRADLSRLSYDSRFVTPVRVKLERFGDCGSRGGCWHATFLGVATAP